MLRKQLQTSAEKQLNNATISSDGDGTSLAAILEHPDRRLPLKQLERRDQPAQPMTGCIVSLLEHKELGESLRDAPNRQIKFVLTPFIRQENSLR